MCPFVRASPDPDSSAATQRVMLLTIVDQGASSVSNFALALIVAHYSSASALGVFAIVTTTYILAQGLVRGLTSDCLLTRSGVGSSEMLRYGRAGYLAAILVASAVSMVTLVVSGVLPAEFMLPFLIFGVAFPMLAMQDFSRFIGIVRMDPSYAIWLDLAWLTLFLATFMVLRMDHLVSLPWTFGAWCVTGAVVGLYTLLRNLARHDRIDLLRYWDRSERHVGLHFAGQFVLLTASNYSIVYLLVPVVPLSAIGQFKLAQLALGPIAVLATGLMTAAVALSAKQFRTDAKRAVRFLCLAGVGMAVFTVVWSIAIYLAPVAAMTRALGSTWPQARSLVPPIGLAFAFAALAGAAVGGLRALRSARANLNVAIVMFPVVLAAGLGGAAISGIRGAAEGLCVAQCVYAIVGWTSLVRVVRGRQSAVDVDDMGRDLLSDDAEPLPSRQV